MPAALAHLADNPFASHGPDRNWFAGGDHEEALSRMLYLAERGVGSGVICGVSGSGKTQLLRELRRELRSSSRTIVELNVAGWDRTTFVVAVANACGAMLSPAAPVQIAWAAVEDWLRGRSAVRNRVVWLLDDVDCAAESLMTELRRLARLSESTSTPSVFIAAMEQDDSEPAWRANVDFVMELTPWDDDTSRGFIEELLRGAGGSRDMLDPAAWEELLAAGQGVPARLLRMMEVTVLASRAMDAEQVSVELMTAVAHQLGWSDHRSHSRLPVD